MRNTILRIIYGIALFCAAFVLMVTFSSDNSLETTAQQQDPKLPVISMELSTDAGSILFNCLHGVTSEQDAGKMREVLTPLSSERAVEIQIDTYGVEILSATAEARDLTGERLIESDVLELEEEEEDVVTATISFKNLLDPGEEYLMVILLETEDYTEIAYSCRIIYEEDGSIYDDAEEALEFAFAFHEASFGESRYAEYLTYLEPDSDEENDTLQHVTLYSSTDQVTWGDLDPECVSEPVYSIIDRQGATFGISGTYYICSEDEDTQEETRYFVEEYYELKKGTDRYYLQDYDRTVSQVFNPSSPQGTDGTIELGIVDEDIEVFQNEEGDTTAFVLDGRLYAVEEEENCLVYVFGFDSAEDTGDRETYHHHDIRILNVNEEGDIDFLVYGYMNSGSHEGQMGSLFYHYSGEYHTVEELAFISYDGSWEMLQYSIEEICYYSEDENHLYLILNDNLCEIDLTACSVRVIEGDLSRKKFVVSESGQLIAYATSNESDETDESDQIVLMDLGKMEQQEILAQENEKLIPLGFLGEDLIYGIVELDETMPGDAGVSSELMSHIVIVDSSLEVLEDYYREGFYITSVEVEENQLTLHRVQKTETDGTENSYAGADTDVIISSEGEESDGLISTEYTDRYQTVVSIEVGDIDMDSLRYIRPQEILYEGSREIFVEPESEEEAKDFYVYNCEGLVRHSYSLAEAIELASSFSTGVVVDDEARYLWRKNYDSYARIEMEEDEETIQDEGEIENDMVSSSAVESTLAAVLSYEGESCDVAALLDEGMTAIEILTEEIEDANVYDLTGCGLTEILYYVSEQTPVYAVTGTDTAVLIVGYDTDNVIFYNAQENRTDSMDQDSAEEELDSVGNRFIVYVKGQSY